MRIGVAGLGATALATAALLAAPGAGADPTSSKGVDAADATEIVEVLVDLPSSRHANDLAAMHSWAALYGKYHDAAKAGDANAMRMYLLVAFVTLARADAGTSESFSGDLLPLYREQADGLLGALADNAWLVEPVCFYIGNGFGFEGRDVTDRPAFLQAESNRIRVALPDPSARRCLAQIAEPTRPTRYP